jgi:hypothetical protein
MTCIRIPVAHHMNVFMGRIFRYVASQSKRIIFIKDLLLGSVVLIELLRAGKWIRRSVYIRAGKTFCIRNLSEYIIAVAIVSLILV